MLRSLKRTSRHYIASSKRRMLVIAKMQEMTNSLLDLLKTSKNGKRSKRALLSRTSSTNSRATPSKWTWKGSNQSMILLLSLSQPHKSRRSMILHFRTNKILTWNSNQLRLLQTSHLKSSNCSQPAQSNWKNLCQKQPRTLLPNSTKPLSKRTVNSWAISCTTLRWTTCRMRSTSSGIL